MVNTFAGDEAAMVTLGSALASGFAAGLVVFLEGELGMGKTTLARGILQALGHNGAVKSPTYTLVEPYELPAMTVYHFDLYRLGDPEELEYMGIRDYFGENSVCLVEWPGRGLGVLPPADIVITITSEGTGRRLAMHATTDSGRSVLLAASERLEGVSS
ncbi:MAG: tRNA (adenosine(37)-N6)-threonylcarbamoyltransferase complex ATPase subunit type 1 TsaE [Halioglobus sp.]